MARRTRSGKEGSLIPLLPGLWVGPAFLVAAAAAPLPEAVHDLGSEDFAVRERAHRILSGAGAGAVPLLEAALGSDDAEVRARAAELLRRILWWKPDPAELRARLERPLPPLNSGEVRDPVATVRSLSKACGVPIFLPEALSRSEWAGSFATYDATTALEGIRSALDVFGYRVTVLAGGLLVSHEDAPSRAEMIPTLLAGLESEEEDERVGAAVSLCALVGERLGYDPYAAPEARAEGVRTWGRWWETHRERFETEARDARNAADDRLRAEVPGLVASLKRMDARPFAPLFIAGGAEFGSGDPREPDRRLTEIAVRCPEAVLAEALTLTASEHRFARYWAISLLGRHRHAAALKGLLPLLEDPDPGTARLAARALGRIGVREAAGALRGTASGKRDPLTRGFAAYALGQLGEKDALPFLIELSADGTTAEAARHCLRMLTGAGMGAFAEPESPDAWRAWWGEHGDALEWDPRQEKFSAPAGK